MIKNRYLEIGLDEITEEELEELKKKLTLRNAAYFQAMKFTGKKPDNIQSTLKVYKIEDNKIYIPREFDTSKEGKELLKWNITKYPEQLHNPININWKPHLTLRDYQIQPAKEMHTNNLLNLKCGAGKTVIAIKHITEVKEKTAIVVDTNILVDQWKTRLLDFTDIKEEDIGYFKGGKFKDGKVVICLIQSLMKKKYEDNKEFYDQFPIVIFDEVHVAGATVFFNVTNRFPGKRIGLTATMTRTDKIRTFIWSIGENVVQTESRALTPLIHIIPTKTYIYDSKYTIRGDTNMPILINHLTADEERTKLIIQVVNDAIKANRNIIILTHRKIHGKKIYDGLETDRKALIMGKSPKPTKREVELTKMKEEQIKKENINYKEIQKAWKKVNGYVVNIEHDDPQVIISTYTYLHKGFDNDSMDTLIMTTPTGASNTIEQSVGRVLRAKEGRKSPIVIDIADVLTRATLGYTKHRISIYKKLKYEVEKNKEYSPNIWVEGELND